MVLAALLFGSVACPLVGQGPRIPAPIPSSHVVVQPARFRISPDSSSHKRTYWVEGGLIGALGGLVIAQTLNNLSCGDSANCGGDRSLLFGLFGGFVIGSLIGGGIDKKS